MLTILYKIVSILSIFKIYKTQYYCESESISCSVMSNSLQPYGLQPTRLLCPWDSPGKNTGVSCHSLLQGIFLTEGSNPGLLHCRQILYNLSHQGRPGLLYDPAISLLGIYPKRMKAGTQNIFVNSCSQPHYSQQSKGGIRSSVYQWTNGYTQCGLYTYSGM